MQRHKVDLGVDRGGLRVAMAQNLGDFAKRSAPTEHLGRQRMTQQVRALGGRVDASAAQGP